MHRLDTVRLRLLELHRLLIALEREDYERLHGRVSGAAFLRVLTTDPAFGWLKPMTAMILALDDMLEAGADLTDADRLDAIARVRALLAPDESGSEFQRRYADALQQSPHVLMAHGEVMKAL
jgi:hypothetical protein